MKTNEITAAILMVQSKEELKLINEALSYQWSRVTKAQAKAFRVGERVEWNSKNGLVEKGTVAKVNQKTVQVKTVRGSTWRVSPSLLRKVA